MYRFYHRIDPAVGFRRSLCPLHLGEGLFGFGDEGGGWAAHCDLGLKDRELSQLDTMLSVECPPLLSTPRTEMGVVFEKEIMVVSNMYFSRSHQRFIILPL